MRTVEYAVHGWDLSQAIQIDHTIPTPLASFLARAVEASRFLLGGSRGHSPKPCLWILLPRRKCPCPRSPDARRSGLRSRSDISNARKIG